jgi:hypothetical protein
MRDLNQQLIPRSVTEGVVDDLESIEVHDEHGKSLAMAFGASDFPLQSVQEQDSIRKSGKSIMGCLMFQVGVGPLESQGLVRVSC